MFEPKATASHSDSTNLTAREWGYRFSPENGHPANSGISASGSNLTLGALV